MGRGETEPPGGPRPPRVDTGRLARLYSAQAGGIWGEPAERAAAAEAEVRWPGTGEQVRAAREFGSRAAVWAVRQAGARGLVIGAAGYPGEPAPRRAALDAEPEARAVVCDPDPEAVLLNRAALRGDPRAAACEATVSDPAALLACPEVEALPRPLFVLMPLVAHFWPPGFAAFVLREWGRLLPAGSVTALSLWIPDGTRAGREFTAWFSGRGARMHAHSPEDVAAWLEGAGMTVEPPGVRDVRGWTGPARSEASYARRAPGRVVGAVARVPRPAG